MTRYAHSLLVIHDSDSVLDATDVQRRARDVLVEAGFDVMYADSRPARGSYPALSGGIVVGPTVATQK